MFKHRIIIDWIAYLTLIIILSFVIASGCFYIAEIAEYGIKPPFNITFIMGYTFARSIFAPILLTIFTIVRLIDKNIRSTPIFFK